MIRPLTDLISETVLSSSMHGGGDIGILPPKKKKEKRANNRVSNVVNRNNLSKLRNSKKRKLRKLEEEKEMEIARLKSIETLERYKIQENAYPLMWSSRNLGQVETAGEKRRREAEYYKAGLIWQDRDRRPCKKIRSDNLDHDVEQQENIIHPKVTGGCNYLDSSLSKREIAVNASVIAGLPADLNCSSGTLADAESSAFLTEEVSTGTIQLSSPKPVSVTPISNSDNPLDSTSVDHPETILSGPENVGDYLPAKCVSSPTIVVHVSRPKEVETTRRDLPIVMMEQEIMEAINEHDNVIICGETGCGKTTQVPQFLYEAGFGSSHLSTRGGIIGVTQPRRVAVLSTAKRVAFELGLCLGKDIGFQVRHDRRVGDNCSIKFMTDGILLREVQSDFLLKRYSAIILDEAHERSLNTDILIGMLSRVIQQRQSEFKEQQTRILSGEIVEDKDRIYPLKLILMSATLRVEDFLSGRRIFRNPPPVIEIPVRQYPVAVHFSKRTEVIDYIGQAFKKVLSIHKRLPPGGILVFVTGQREVEYLCQKLRRASRDMVENAVTRYGGDERISEENGMKEINEAFEFQENCDREIVDRYSCHLEDNLENLSEDDFDNSSDSSEESDLEFYSENEIHSKLISFHSDDKPVDNLGVGVSLDSLKVAFETLTGTHDSNPKNHFQNVTPTSEGNADKSSSIVEKNVKGNDSGAGPMHVLPLYSMLPATAQLRVFEEVKEGERLVVVATNVAETSLTIPGIRYVVDTGREKVKKYNTSNGMETYEIQWISKASAAQRAGRSGRTGPGHCYRLYSSAVFSNMFNDFSSAEILKVPVDGVVLLMKSMHINKVSNFPFPTPPESNALIEAEHCLKLLEALDSKGRLTPLGKAMSLYPMSPRHSRMLLTVIEIMQRVEDTSRANLVLGYAAAAAAALSFSSPFTMHFDSDDVAADSANIPDAEKKLMRKKMREVVKLSRENFANPSSDALTVARAVQCFELSSSPFEFCRDCALHYKTMEEMSKLRKQILQLVFRSNANDLQQEFLWTHGTVEDIERAWRVSSNKHPLKLNEEEILGQAICAGWADRVAKRVKAGSSVINEDRKVKAVRYQACMVKETVFLHRLSSISKSPPEFLVYSELLHSKRPYIHGATSVKSSWLLKYAQPFCTFSAPLSDPKPHYDPKMDKLFSWVTPTFGPYLWQLPLHRLPIASNDTRVAVFACSLLEGQVLPCLKTVGKYLAGSPSSILKPEAQGLKRVGNLLSKLNRKRIVIDSCEKLRELWNDDPTELFLEIRDWFQKDFHCHFEELWAEMHLQVVLEPTERFTKKIKGGKRKKKS